MKSRKHHNDFLCFLGLFVAMPLPQRGWGRIDSEIEGVCFTAEGAENAAGELSCLHDRYRGAEPRSAPLPLVWERGRG